MKARDLMKSDLTTVSADSLLKDAAGLLAKLEITGLPVANSQNEVIGFISERDIIAAAFPESLTLKTPEVVSLTNLSLIVRKLNSQGTDRVDDHIGPRLFCVKEEADLHEIVELMLDKNLKRLPVLRNKQLVGIIERAAISKVAMELGL
ncbi:HPP family protein [Candidatus Margulisiibacteriota bacterium]